MKRSAIVLLTLTLTSAFVFAASDRRKEDIWVPMEERGKIWDEVVSNNDK